MEFKGGSTFSARTKCMVKSHKYLLTDFSEVLISLVENIKGCFSF